MAAYFEGLDNDQYVVVDENWVSENEKKMSMREMAANLKRSREHPKKIVGIFKGKNRDIILNLFGNLQSEFKHLIDPLVFPIQCLVIDHTSDGISLPFVQSVVCLPTKSYTRFKQQTSRAIRLDSHFVRPLPPIAQEKVLVTIDKDDDDSEMVEEITVSVYPIGPVPAQTNILPFEACTINVGLNFEVPQQAPVAAAGSSAGSSASSSAAGSCAAAAAAGSSAAGSSAAGSSAAGSSAASSSAAGSSARFESPPFPKALLFRREYYYARYMFYGSRTLPIGSMDVTVKPCECRNCGLLEYRFDGNKESRLVKRVTSSDLDSTKCAGVSNTTNDKFLSCYYCTFGKENSASSSSSAPASPFVFENKTNITFAEPPKFVLFNGTKDDVEAFLQNHTDYQPAAPCGKLDCSTVKGALFSNTSDTSHSTASAYVLKVQERDSDTLPSGCSLLNLNIAKSYRLHVTPGWVMEKDQMETYFKHSIAVNVHFKRFVKSFLSLPQGAKHDTPLMCKLLLRAYASTPNTLKFVAKNVEDYAAKLNEWGQNVERFVENCLEHYDLNIASLIENDRSQAMSDAISAILQRDAKLEEAVDISRRLMSFAAAAAGLVTSSMRDTRDQTTKLEELMKDDDLKIPDDILNRFKKQTKRYKWTNVFYHGVVTSKWEGTDYSLKYEDGAIVAVGG